MKTRVLALAFASVFALGLSAQEVTPNNNLADQPGKKVTFQRNAGTDNWFLQLRGGTNYGVAFTSQKVATGDDYASRFGWNAGLAVGKWFNPYFGSRVAVDFTNTRNQYIDGKDKDGKNLNVLNSEKDGNKDVDFYGLNPHIDFMFNPVNFFGAYKADRVVSFVPYIGVGCFARGNNVDPKAEFLQRINYSVSANLGFDLGFRLSKVVDLVIAPSVVFSNLYDNTPVAIYRPNDMLAKLDLGLNFNLGKSDFEAIEPMDYALLNNLQSEINSLRSQNAELSKRPVRCPECPEVSNEVKTIVKSENTVYFRIGSAKVDRNQLMNIYNTAEFVKANNVPVTVVGYADVQTGTADYNMQLSEKRAREVARILADEYGVPTSQITIDYKGSSVQPYENINAWNRVVIMTAEK